MKTVCFEINSKEEFLKEIDELIKKNLEAFNFVPPDDTLMTRQEVADYFSISLPTLHSWMQQEILHYYRIGNKVKFKKKEVLAALRPSQKRRKSYK